MYKEETVKINLDLDEILEKEKEYIQAFENLLKLKQERAEKERELKEIEQQIEFQVAFNSELKNDRQRNAQKHSLLSTNTKYLSLQKEIIEIEKQIINAEVEYLHKKNLYKLNLELIKLAQNLDN